MITIRRVIKTHWEKRLVSTLTFRTRLNKALALDSVQQPRPLPSPVPRGAGWGVVNST